MFLINIEPFFKKTSVLSIVGSKCGHDYKKIIKE